MQQRLTKEQAWQKIKHYCAYQERSHSEVKQKLYGFGLYKNDVEELLTKAIEEDYLNEERFASLFAGGKFRMKHWGRIKITHELKLKGVSSYNIKRAMQEIPEDDYKQTLLKLAANKWQQNEDEHYLTRQAKTASYLLQKGYESPLVQKAIQELRTGNEAS